MASFQRWGLSPFADTRRFSVYAPYVKNLDVFSAEGQYWIYGDWDPLFAYSSEHTLLPNLVTLCLQMKNYHGHWQIPLWATLFVSTSLKDLLYTPQPFDKPPETSHKVLGALVKCLAEKSPRLRQLSIFADYPPNQEGARLVSSTQGETLDQDLAYAAEIRSICCNLVFLTGKGILDLGRLAHLETLTIHSDRFNSGDLGVTELPDDLFSSLRCLNLCFWRRERFDTVFKLRPVFSRVTTLNFRFEFGINVSLYEWVVSELFPSLGDVPGLRNLSLYFDHSDYIEWTLSMIPHSLSDLPLKSLAIYPAIFDFSNTCDLGATWTQLTYLELPQNSFTTSELPPFSELPSLQRLLVQLNLNLNFGLDHRPRLNPLPFHTLEASETSRYKTDMRARDCGYLHGPVNQNCPHAHRSDDLDKLAGFLLSFWPNLRHVIWPKGSDGQPSRLVQLLDQRLQSLQPREDIQAVGA
ncbi:hypothetical protein BDV93DRAFT_559791 [Ceratobasidium sp. AG-I]|nr:hypothetical protein BDV93DRAFT_559791 [Ceratobasidium sp. AG-I]